MGIPAADTTTYPLVDMARNCNFALDRINSLILKSDGRWDYDDSNQNGELLDTSIALVSGTSKYAIALTWLKIGRIRVKDSAGNWISLAPVDRRELSGSQLTVSSGTPRSYDKMGNYIYLYPAPNYVSTGGLEVQFQRGASYFAASDTTKTPGFAINFHRLVSFYGALDYCEVNGLNGKTNIIQGKINSMEAELIEFYSNRNNDEQPHITFTKSDYGDGSLGGGGGHPDRFNV